MIFLVIFQANAKRNFDETIEAHVRLGIKKERTDQVRALGHMLAYFRHYLICVGFECLELKLFVGLNCWWFFFFFDKYMGCWRLVLYMGLSSFNITARYWVDSMFWPLDIIVRSKPMSLDCRYSVVNFGVAHIVSTYFL